MQFVPRNLSGHSIEVPPKQIVGKVTLGQPGTTNGPPGGDPVGSTHGPQKGWILDEMNLQGLEEWPEVEQEQVRELLLR